jgi:2-methylcitrate dehydratase PrpD
MSSCNSYSLNEQIAAWVSGYRDHALPGPVVESTKLRVVDIVGCMLGAVGHPDVVNTRRVAAEAFPGTQTRSVPFADGTSMAGAALINGTAALVLEFDDSHLESALHSSSPVIAAALPMAHVFRCTGREFITTVAIGNEMTCRLGLGAPGKFHQKGFHPTGIFGTFGAIYAAARCLGLDASNTANAIGIGGSLSSGLMASWEDGSAAKSLHAGFSALAAVNAAFCAKNGISGPRGVFDGRFGFFKAHVQDESYPFAFSRVTDGLGDEWEALKIAPKAYPCGHYIQPLIEAALALRREHCIEPEQVASISCWIPAYVIPLIAEPLTEKRRPKTSFHGRFSLQHSMAEAMIQGTLDKNSFDTAGLKDRRHNELADKVHAVVDPLATDRSQLGGRVEIRLQDGRTMQFTVEHMRGMPQNPMTVDDIVRKFRSNVDNYVPDSQSDRILDIIMSLDRMSDLQPLLTELGERASRSQPTV